MASLSEQPMLLRSTTPGEEPRINAALTEEYGLTLDDLASKPLLEWVHPDDRSAMRQALDAGEGELLARHAVRQGEWQMLRWRVRTDAGRVVALAMSHRVNQAHMSVAEALPSPKPSLAETLESMVHIVESKANGCRCSILLVEADGEHVSVGAGPSMPEEYNRAVQGLRIVISSSVFRTTDTRH